MNTNDKRESKIIKIYHSFPIDKCIRCEKEDYVILYIYIYIFIFIYLFLFLFYFILCKSILYFIINLK